MRSSGRATPSRRRGLRIAAALLAAASLLSDCSEAGPFGEPSLAVTAHERYAESLRSAGLDGTALGRDWLSASASALAAPIPATLPFREAGYFAAGEAIAVGYLLRAARGQRLVARVAVQGDPPTRLFMDLFLVPLDSAAAPERLASTDSAGQRIEWEPRRDGEYILRIQPELLRSGRYTVTVAAEPALAFPVDGRDSRAIQSVFGVERDGGARAHHGVDIFAPRGTPAIAAAAGVVSRVETTPRGGKVVWLRDAARGQNLYYAHLDSQTVVSGARVRPGDTLGLVGNTGNARTTPPHLHFGIYRRGEGPIDPMVWIRDRRARPAELAADTGRLGEWSRSTASGGSLRAEPAAGAAVVGDLPGHTAVRLAGASGAWYRVALPDGRTGYLPARSVETSGEPLRMERLARGTLVRESPSPGATVVDSVAVDTDVAVLGRFGPFLRVETPGGRTGWLAGDAI